MSDIAYAVGIQRKGQVLPHGLKVNQERQTEDSNAAEKGCPGSCAEYGSEDKEQTAVTEEGHVPGRMEGTSMLPTS